MTFDVANLHGAWESLDEDGMLTLDVGGDFRFTPPSDTSLSGDQLVDIVGAISGKWKIDDGKLKLNVDLRSVRFSSSSWLMRFGLKIFTFLLRFFDERDIVDDKVTCLTATDLWLENSNGKVSKFRKK